MPVPPQLPNRMIAAVRMAVSVGEQCSSRKAVAAAGHPRVVPWSQPGPHLKSAAYIPHEVPNHSVYERGSVTVMEL